MQFEQTGDPALNIAVPNLFRSLVFILRRWFAEILGSASGIAGHSGSHSDRSVKVDSRLVTPALKTLDILLSQGLLGCLDRPRTASGPAAAGGVAVTSAAPSGSSRPTITFGEEVVAFTRRRLETGSEDVQRTLAGAQVYLGLLSFTSGLARCHATLALLDMLGHGFPRIRRAVSELLYTRLLALESESWGRTTLITTRASVSSSSDSGGTTTSASAAAVQETLVAAPPPIQPDLDSAIALLSEVVWDGEPLAVLPQRDRLYGLLLGMEAPPPLRAQCGIGAHEQAAESTGGANEAEGGTGYAALVRDAGY